jgi:hypothetical protein
MSCLTGRAVALLAQAVTCVYHSPAWPAKEASAPHQVVQLNDMI